MTSAELRRLIRLNLLCLIVFGVVATSLADQEKLVENSEGIVNDLLRTAHLDQIDIELKHTEKLSQVLLATLLRTSLLYVYLILTLYYVILIEAEDLLRKSSTLVGKLMVLLTFFAYFIAEYYLPIKDMLSVVHQLTIALFILSALQVFHLVYSICEFCTMEFVKYWIQNYIWNILLWLRQKIRKFNPRAIAIDTDGTAC